MNNTGTILFHQGFTDVINCLPLVNVLSKKFDKINLLMRNDFKEIIDFYLKSLPNVNACYVDKSQIDNNLSSLLNDYRHNSSLLIFGMFDGYRNDSYQGAFSNRDHNLFFVEKFYKSYGIDYSERVSMFEFDRDLNLEESTYSKFVEEHGNDYVLYHGLNDSIISSIRDKHPTSKLVDLNKSTNTFFDYIKILQNAKDIHVLDSVWGAFLYQVDSKYELFNHITISTYCLRGHNEMFTKPTSLKNWKII
jgi:hypothetical protein|tara:strand:+ start:406 stop:1152 length:747 start_codon:yes stop_codon:yes gene_type:complete